MINADIKVTVIMPIYNESDYLAPALDSVIDQTLKNIEIICVDDGSTDGSLDIIKEYQKNDSRIRIVTETNAGPALARNNGIKRARGKYLAFLDADDFYAPTLLEELYTEAERLELDITIANYDIYNSKKATFEKVAPVEHEHIYEPGKVTSKNDYPDYIFTSTNGAAWNKLFRTSFVIEKQLSFIQDVKMYEDVYFTITALSLAERVGKVHKILLHHRVYSEQSRAKMFRKHYEQIPYIYSEIKKFLMHNGMYSPLSRSYLNFTASRLFKIYNMIGFDLKDNLWNILHSEYVEVFDWQNHTADEFDSAEVCDFVANVVIYDYKQYKRRLSRRGPVADEKLGKNMKNAKKKRRVRAFFAKLFGKKTAQTK